MGIIEKEYPEDRRIIEMVLVKMLIERRSWADYKDIADALRNVRRHAERMQKERDHLASDACAAGKINSITFR